MSGSGWRNGWCLIAAGMFLLATAAMTRGATFDGFLLLSVKDLRGMLEHKEPGLVIIDTRSSDEYQEAHLKGAVSIPLPQLEQSPQLLRPYGARDPLVFYCNGFS